MLQQPANDILFVNQDAIAHFPDHLVFLKPVLVAVKPLVIKRLTGGEYVRVLLNELVNRYEIFNAQNGTSPLSSLSGQMFIQLSHLMAACPTGMVSTLIAKEPSSRWKAGPIVA
jgi:hypothetical protein